MSAADRFARLLAMSFAVFFLSTGRCGTQWLTRVLQTQLKETARVEHEPLHNGYQPRKIIGLRDPGALPAKQADRIFDHIDSIERTLDDRMYIETGHPSWSTLPYLADRLRGRIRIVHLVRHPVPTAYSWLSHGAYIPPWLPHLVAKDLLVPTDPGVLFPEYSEEWSGLHPWEKCLYYWAEINAFGLNWSATAAPPWYRLSYEELFAGTGLAGLFEFLSVDAKIVDLAGRERVDKYHYGLCEWPSADLIARHPKVIDIATQLGYDWRTFDMAALRRRYGLGP